jgi:hypothetical protein
MSATQIVDAAIKLYRQHFKALIGLVAWLLLPFGLIRALLLRYASGGSAGPGALGPQPSFGAAFSAGFSAALGPHGAEVVFGFAAIQILVISPFLTLAVARASAEFYLGRDLSLGTAYRAAAGRYLAVLGAVVLAFIFEGIGYLFLIIPGIFLYIRLVLAPVTVMLEATGPFNAIERSWRLTKGNWWRIFWLLALTAITVAIVDAIVALIPNVLAHFAGPAGWIVSGLGTSAGLIIVTPFTTIVLVLVYFDLRIRKEGFDLAVVAEQLRPR